jgi:histidine triad (HIT) family protein
MDKIYVRQAVSLYQTYDPKNIFTKILSGEIPCAKIYEDAQTLSFMDAFPQSQGHCLVIPKVAACNLFDISPDDLSHLIGQTQRMARAVRDALSPDGIQILQYNGTAGGQSVFHLHFHIVPRWADLSLKPHRSGAKAEMSDLNDLAQRIIAKLA